MSWRTVLISKRSKLDLKMGYLVVRGEETRRVFLDDIAILVIENTGTSLTCALLEALVEKKIRVIFCDHKHNPMGELVPYYGSYDCARKLKQQIEWPSEVQGQVWTEIIAEKIRKQHQHLLELEKQKEASLLEGYLQQLTLYDETNREGHAAKVYFNALFGMGFSRREENPTNALLNYGYGVLLAAVNREVSINGYLTQMGLHHIGPYNNFNLSCDLMEPYRILIDRVVVAGQYTELEGEAKIALWRVLSETVVIDGNKQLVMNAIKIYVKSVFDALNAGDPALIKHYEV